MWLYAILQARHDCHSLLNCIQLAFLIFQLDTVEKAQTFFEQPLYIFKFSSHICICRVHTYFEDILKSF